MIPEQEAIFFRLHTGGFRGRPIHRGSSDFPPRGGVFPGTSDHLLWWPPGTTGRWCRKSKLPANAIIPPISAYPHNKLQACHCEEPCPPKGRRGSDEAIYSIGPALRVQRLRRNLEARHDLYVLLFQLILRECFSITARIGTSSEAGIASHSFAMTSTNISFSTTWYKCPRNRNGTFTNRSWSNDYLPLAAGRSGMPERAPCRVVHPINPLHQGGQIDESKGHI